MVLDRAAGPASVQESRDSVGDHEQRFGQEYWIMLQALHLFKKAEILLETMNKELDKSIGSCCRHCICSRKPRFCWRPCTKNWARVLDHAAGPASVQESRRFVGDHE